MAVQTVACPGCKATLKAPEQMAGKKAKCKKCGVSFRIPGGDAPGDSTGDRQFLSAMDLPVPAAADNPFAFGEEPAEPQAKPAEKEKPAKKSAVAAKPEPKPEPPKASPKPLPKLPSRKPKEAEPDEDDEDAIPAAAVVDDEEPEAEPAPTAPASADPFAFSDEPAPTKKKSKKRDDDEDEPRDEKKSKKKSKPKDEEPAPASSGNAFSQKDSVVVWCWIYRGLLVVAIVGVACPWFTASASVSAPTLGVGGSSRASLTGLSIVWGLLSLLAILTAVVFSFLLRIWQVHSGLAGLACGLTVLAAVQLSSATPFGVNAESSFGSPYGSATASVRSGIDWGLWLTLIASGAAVVAGFVGGSPGMQSRLGMASFGEEAAPAGLRDDSDDDQDDDDDRDRKKSSPKSEDKKKPAKRGYQTKEGGKGSGGKLIIAAIVFGVIVAAGVGGAIIYSNQNKPPETANNEKKNPDPVPPNDPNAKGSGVEPPKPPDMPTPTPNPKDKGTNPPKKDPPGKKPAGPGPMLALGPGRTINFLPPAAKLEAVQEPSNRLMIIPTLPGAAANNAFAAARKVVPPLKRDIDIGVVWETAKGLQGAGEKLLLGIYSPQTGKQVNQVAFDGDGSADPVCDLSGDANLFIHGHTGTGKVTVWDTRTGMKVVDGFNPYTAPKSKDLKLAAVYLTEPPIVFITVSTTGAVHAFNVKTKDPMAGDFTPAKPPSKPLVAGQHIAAGPNHLSVIVYSGGSFYQVNIGPTVDGKEVVRLDGDVGRSFGLSSSAGGRMVFAFETDEKKEKAVMEVRGDGKHQFYRWPDKDAGDPTGIAWVDDGLVMVASNRGSCVWFEAEGSDFKPIGLARTPMDKARHVASDGHWTLLPDPMNAKQCVLVEYSKPQSGIIGALDSVKQPPSALLTDKGLFK